MSDAERLARAVLLFFSSTPWTIEKQREWQMLTGTLDGNATSKTLCDLAREMTPTTGAEP